MLFIDICEFFDSTSMYILSLDRSAEQEIRQLLFLAPIEVTILGESNLFSMILTCLVCRKTARENVGDACRSERLMFHFPSIHPQTIGMQLGPLSHLFTDLQIPSRACSLISSNPKAASMASN